MFLCSCSSVISGLKVKLSEQDKTNLIKNIPTQNSTKRQLGSNRIYRETNRNIIDASEGVQPLEKEVIISPQEIERLEKAQRNKTIVQNTPQKTGGKRVRKNKEPFHFELTLKNTKYTRQYFDYYAKINRRTFQRWLKRAEPYIPYIQKVFREHHIPDDLIFLPFSESGFNPRAYSRAGAVGLWQFMPATARKYGLTVNWWVDERLDPYRSTIAAANYLTDLYKMFGDWYLVLAAYNAGEGKVQKALRRSKKNDFFHIAKPRYLRRETRMYVPKFMAILKIIKNLDSLGFHPIRVDKSLIPGRVFVKQSTDLYTFAKKLGMRWRAFRKLNPHFKRYVTPPDVMSQVYVPKRLVAKAKELILSKKLHPYGGLVRYRIKVGDSWWRLSRKFRVPIYILKKINRTYSNLLRPGRSLLIPRSTRRVYVAKRSYIHRRSKKRLSARHGNYIVKKGDSLWKISRKFNVPISTLRVANNLYRKTLLRPGMELYIPKTDSSSLKTAKKVMKQILYSVRRGDNLWNIARKFGVSTTQLLTWNNLKKDARIYPGDKLKILVELVAN